MYFFYLEYIVLAFAIVYFARKMREESRTDKNPADHSTGGHAAERKRA